MEDANREETQKIVEYFESMGLRFNAQKKFNEIKTRLTSGNYDYDDEIFRIIDSVIMEESSQFIKTIPQNTTLYRARVVNIDDFNDRKNGLSFNLLPGNQENHGYNEVNSREAPIGRSGEGRNNIQGVSYLYLADTPETACAEIKSSVRSLVSLAEFKTMREMKIVDFSKDVSFERQKSLDDNMSYGVFFTLLLSSFTSPDKNNYKITQIISDYIRRYGVDGIAYRSFYTMQINYTIFNSYRNSLEFCGSKILLHAYSNEYFWDFQNEKSIETVPHGKGPYEHDIAEGIKKELSMVTTHNYEEVK